MRNVGNTDRALRVFARSAADSAVAAQCDRPLGLAGVVADRYRTTEGMPGLQRAGFAVLPGAAKHRQRLSKQRDVGFSKVKRVALGALDLDTLDLDQSRQAVFQNAACHRR